MGEKSLLLTLTKLEASLVFKDVYSLSYYTGSVTSTKSITLYSFVSFLTLCL